MKNNLIRLAIASILVTGIAEAGDWFRPSSKAPVAPQVHRDCLSYDFIDLQYVGVDFGSPYFSDEGGFGVGFSKSIGSKFFINGDYTDGSYDYDWVNHVVPVETRRYRLGAGVRVPLAECVHVTLEGGAEHLDAEYGGSYSDHDYDSWAWYVGPGFRARSGRFEVYAKALYLSREGDFRQEYLSHHTTHYGRVDSYGWLFTPGVIFHLNDRLGIKLGAEIDSHDTVWLAGARLHF